MKKTINEIKALHSTLSTIRGIGNQHMSYGIEQNLSRLEQCLRSFDADFQKTQEFQAYHAHLKDIGEQLKKIEPEKVKTEREKLVDKEIEQLCMQKQETLATQGIEITPYMFREARLREITMEEIPEIRSDKDDQELPKAEQLRIVKARFNLVLTELECLTEV